MVMMARNKLETIMASEKAKAKRAARRRAARKAWQTRREKEYGRVMYALTL